MSGQRHTPGPWNYKYLRDLLRYGRKWDGPWDEHVTGLDQHEPDEDDARLIAAAPELLEVLEAALNWYGPHFREAVHWHGPYADGGEPAWLSKARAAIAKAKGEDQ